MVDRVCHCYWCSRPVEPGSIFCRPHHYSLPAASRTVLDAAVEGAVALLAAERMRKAVASLPKETQAMMRRTTRDS